MIIDKINKNYKIKFYLYNEIKVHNHHQDKIKKRIKMINFYKIMQTLIMIKTMRLKSMRIMIFFNNLLN